MNTPGKQNTDIRPRLILVCDILMLNACCITLAYALIVGTDWLWAFVVLNNLSIIALRRWLICIFQINWLASPLNRTIKRGLDIILSLALLLTVFPCVFVVRAILFWKTRHGAVLTFRKMQINDKEFDSLVFNSTIHKTSFGVCFPIIFNILCGTISFWDLKQLRTPVDHEPVPPATVDTANCNSNIHQDNQFSEHEHIQ